VCVINSAAFHDCSVHARAILIELVARMNGCNNGKIAVSQREFAALRCHARKVVRGIVELWEHGLLDVTVSKGEANGMYRHGGWTKEAVELRRRAAALLRTIRQSDAESPDR